MQENEVVMRFRVDPLNDQRVLLDVYNLDQQLDPRDFKERIQNEEDFNAIADTMTTAEMSVSGILLHLYSYGMLDPKASTLTMHDALP